MNRKTLLALLVVVVVAGGAGLVVYRQSSASWRQTSRDGKVLDPFEPDRVAQVILQSGTNTVTLEKKDDLWTVRERDGYPAEFQRLGNLVRELWDLKPVQQIEAGPKQLDRFDLLPPKAEEKNTAQLVELRDDGGKPLTALLIGKPFLKKSHAYPDDEGYPAGRYVMPAGAEPPRVSIVSERLEIENDPAAWLDKSFFGINAIASVAVDAGEAQWKVARESEASSDWKLDGLLPGEALDSAKLPSIPSVFGSLRFEDVLSRNTEQAGLDRVITVSTFDGLTYTLRFGKPDGGRLPMALSLAVTEMPAERTPGKDEKPEEKERLDKEYAAKAKERTATIEEVRKLEKRVYLVPESTFQPFWKPGKELLKVPGKTTEETSASKEQSESSPAPEGDSGNQPKAD